MMGKKKKGFTLVELLVVIAIIALLLAILTPALARVRRLAQRLVCATNLKGLGTAMMLYANDYSDMYPVQGGKGEHTWDDFTEGWQDIEKDWSDGAEITVGASLFLLVREADVGTKSFICKGGDQQPYDGENEFDLDLVELWDFGSHVTLGIKSGPRNHVSYAYQLPYSIGGNLAYPAEATGPAGMAIMADKNPWFDPKLDVGTPDKDNWMGYVDYIVDDWTTTVTVDKWEIQVANSNSHLREGQNVVFGDGHASFEKRSDVGVKNDNIYTRYAKNDAPFLETDIRQGLVPADGQIGAGRPVTDEDSFLVNDDERK